MQYTTALFLLCAVVTCFGQRPFYAGLHAIGFPDTAAASSNVNNHLGDSLPPQLNGDVAYANRLDGMPLDQQPFWYINKKPYEDLLKNPQSYPQRPSIFNDNKVE